MRKASANKKYIAKYSATTAKEAMLKTLQQNLLRGDVKNGDVFLFQDAFNSLVGCKNHITGLDAVASCICLITVNMFYVG